VRNGDRITIDVDRLSVDVDVDAAVLAERRAAMGEIKPRAAKGYLAMYRQAVQGMETGVILLPC
jgi:dihydroxyacid dehydratase/phosphogluconate dehydratase